MVTGKPMSTLTNFINGHFVNSESNTETLPLENPSSGTVYFRVPFSGPKEVESAVEAADHAFKTWKTTSKSQRAMLLRKLADEIEKNIEKLSEIESKSQGKSITRSKTIEIPRAIQNLRFFADLLLSYHGESMESPETGDFSYVIREPIGIVGLIVPWNLPLYLLTWKLAPALAMGNCIVAKPSEFTSQTSLLLAEMALNVGFPPGVINIVVGPGEPTGKLIVEHQKIKAISFTGGTVTGRKIASTCGALGKKVSLELGGKNAAIVFDDHNLEETVKTCVASAFSNQGEICLCMSRIYIKTSIYEKFLNLFTQEANTWLIGEPLLPQGQVGPLINREHLKKVQMYEQIAITENCKVTKCGKFIKHDPNGFYSPLLVVENVPESSKLLKDEIFGPLVCLLSFETMEEVISKVNDTSYGLAACVWSNNHEEITKITPALDVGMIWINCWMSRDLKAPFGGIKGSGIGREGGLNSFNFFSELKTITVKKP